MQIARQELMSTVRMASSSECNFCGFSVNVTRPHAPRQVGLDLKDIPADAQVIDATGKFVMPGESSLQAAGRFN